MSLILYVGVPHEVPVKIPAFWAVRFRRKITVAYRTAGLELRQKFVPRGPPHLLGMPSKSCAVR